MNGSERVAEFLKGLGIRTVAPAAAPAGLDAVETSSRHPARLAWPEEEKLDVGAIEAGLNLRLARYSRLLKDAWLVIFRGQGGLAAHVRVAVANPSYTFDPRVDARPLIDIQRRFAVESMVAGAADGFHEVNRGQVKHGRLELLAVEDGEDALPNVRQTVATIDLAMFARMQGVVLDTHLQKVAERIRLREVDLEQFATTRVAEIRGDIETQIAKLRGQARDLVAAARSQGKAARTVLREGFADLERKWAGMEKDLGVETSALADTIESSAYNEGRQRLYAATSPRVVIGFLYSAVLDSRTTFFCRKWDGFMAPRDHAVWRLVWPPNHWRCRAVIVAVIAGERTLEQLRAAAQQQPSERPQRGFAGMKFVPSVPGS